jgi:carbonic anhydrase
MMRMSMRRLLRALVIGVSLSGLLVYADTNDIGVKVKWGYIGNVGPTKWGQLDPSFVLCDIGRSQSPINIVKQTTKTQHSLTLHYESAPLIMMDNGPTALMMGNTQTIINDGHGVQVNFPQSQSNEFMTWEDKTYRLVEFHFHSPSENQWHGQSYPMEIHFVHQGKRGHVAVIGVFVKGGKENPTLETIIRHLPQQEGKAFPIKGEQINPLDLMPSVKDHYDFAGSLTTPPCTEGVRWIVMADAITASPAQIVQLRKAAGGANARPVQPLNGRTISYTAEAE